MSARINIKDLTEHGLTLVAPSDPSFEGYASAIIRSKHKQIADMFSVLKPFCVVLKNACDKTVVAYQVKWEMTLADGAVVTRESSGSNLTPLMGGGPPGSENARDQGYAIAPDSRRLIYPGSLSLGEGEDSLIGAITGGCSDPADLPRFQQAAQNKDYLAIVRFSTEEWQRYKTVTASIDGAFFEDGTYVR